MDREIKVIEFKANGIVTQIDVTGTPHIAIVKFEPITEPVVSVFPTMTDLANYLDNLPESANVWFTSFVERS